MQLSNSGNSLEIVNEGQPKSYDLSLEQVGFAAGIFSETEVSIGAHQRHLVDVLDWNELGVTQVVMFVKDLGGNVLGLRTLQATIGSTRAFVAEAYETGKIIDVEVRDGLYNKLDAAVEAQARGKTKVVGNILGAFINLVEAQYGKAIDPVVGDILIQDANYIIDS